MEISVGSKMIIISSLSQSIDFLPSPIQADEIRQCKKNDFFVEHKNSKRIYHCLFIYMYFLKCKPTFQTLYISKNPATVKKQSKLFNNINTT